MLLILFVFSCEAAIISPSIFSNLTLVFRRFNFKRTKYYGGTISQSYCVFKQSYSHWCYSFTQGQKENHRWDLLLCFKETRRGGKHLHSLTAEDSGRRSRGEPSRRRIPSTISCKEPTIVSITTQHCTWK